MKSINIVKITPLFVLLAFTSLAESNQQEIENNKSLISECVELNQFLAKVGRENNLIGGNGTITAQEPVSFQFVHNGYGYRGVCSNSQFSFKDGALVGTVEHQKFIYIQKGGEAFPEAVKFNDDLWYTVTKPENLEQWMN